MIEIISNVDVAVSAETAWGLVGGFDNLPLWVPMIERSILEQGGRIRHLTTHSGVHIVERLLAYNEQAFSYTYAYIDGPDPVENYRGTVAVTPLGPEHCRVSWGSQFVPVGLSEPEAKEHYRAAYASALLHVKTLLEQTG